MNMLSYLLISYFQKYEFGSRNDVLNSFSMLPPIIRYKVLLFLHKKYPKNISIIDKLVLAIVKTFNVDEATAWVEGKKQDLIKLDTVTENAFNEISENKGIEIAKFIKNISPDNMYILCKSKISEVGELINSNGALYLDFESALPYYEKNGILTGNDPQTTEFNDIMNFLYMGRKEKIRELSNESNPYMILNFIP